MEKKKIELLTQERWLTFDNSATEDVLKMLGMKVNILKRVYYEGKRLRCSICSTGITVKSFAGVYKDGKDLKVSCTDDSCVLMTCLNKRILEDDLDDE